MDNTIKLYIQAHCPSAAKLLLILSKTKTKYKIDMPVYIINSSSDGNSNVSYSSMHGQDELDEDIRQLVIEKYYSDQYWPYVQQLYSTDMRQWEDALQKVGLKKEEILAKQNSEKNELLSANANLLSNIPIMGSPTVLYANRYLVFDRKTFFENEAMDNELCREGNK
jgi:hypothetical protein